MPLSGVPSSMMLFSVPGGLTDEERASIEQSQLREASAASLTQFGTDRDQRADDNRAEIRAWMRARPTLFTEYQHHVGGCSRGRQSPIHNPKPPECPICLERMGVNERVINAHHIQTPTLPQRRRSIRLQRRLATKLHQCCFHERCFRTWSEFSGQIIEDESTSCLVVMNCPSCGCVTKFKSRPR